MPSARKSKQVSPWFVRSWEPDLAVGRPLPETPLLTVDILIEMQGKLVFVKRKNPPHGFALPGGFVDRGECCEAAARREAMEETGLDVTNLTLFGVYSDPRRDPRFHTCSVVFRGEATGEPVGADDAVEALLVDPESMVDTLVFDHGRIVSDYLLRRTEKVTDRFRSYGIVVYSETSQERRYLLVRKKAKWEFPKGRRKVGESNEEAARRELAEETGLSDLSLEPTFCAVDSYERTHERGRKEVTFFLAAKPDRQAVKLSHEHQEFGWFSAAKARTRLTRDAMKRILDCSDRYLGPPC